MLCWVQQRASLCVLLGKSSLPPLPVLHGSRGHLWCCCSSRQQSLPAPLHKIFFLRDPDSGAFLSAVRTMTEEGQTLLSQVTHDQVPHPGEEKSLGYAVSVFHLPCRCGKGCWKVPPLRAESHQSLELRLEVGDWVQAGPTATAEWHWKTGRLPRPHPNLRNTTPSCSSGQLTLFFYFSQREGEYVTVLGSF